MNSTPNDRFQIRLRAKSKVLRARETFALVLVPCITKAEFISNQDMQSRGNPFLAFRIIRKYVLQSLGVWLYRKR
jgi:hypothetical protein